jgi:hypothetical protein
MICYLEALLDHEGGRGMVFKAKISDSLSKILRDPSARRELMKIINSGQPGSIQVGTMKYRVSTSSSEHISQTDVRRPADLQTSASPDIA